MSTETNITTVATKSKNCLSCGKSFSYIPKMPGEISHMDTIGNPVFFVLEYAPTFCPKCMRRCRKKDGRP